MHIIHFQNCFFQAPFEADRRARDEEVQRLGSMPEWKRNLIMKKKGEM